VKKKPVTEIPEGPAPTYPRLQILSPKTELVPRVVAVNGKWEIVPDVWVLPGGEEITKDQILAQLDVNDRVNVITNLRK
jgi:hypothetical protein